MRYWPAVTAASILAIAGSQAAHAGEWAYDWGGQANLSAYGIDQDEVAASPLNDFGFAAEAKGWGRVKLITDSGLEYGLRGQLRAQSPEHKFSNDAIHGAPEFVDEVWLYMQTAFGRLTVGLEDGAADSAGIFSPTVSEINRLDDARAFALQDPLGSSFTPFSPNGAHVRTDLSATGDALKVIYYSPRLIGVQLSASFTPELTRSVTELFNNDDKLDQQSNIWEVGVNYQGSLSSFDVGFYAGYVSGTNESPSVGHTVGFVSSVLGAPANVTSIAFSPDDLQEWGAGGQVAYEGLKLGGSYRVTNVAGGAGLADARSALSPSVGCAQVAGCVLPDSNTTIWGAGVTYETGPWKIGAEYVDLDEELPPYLDGTVKTVSQKATGWSGSIGYEFDENARIAAGFQHYAFEGPAGACVTGITSVCDTLDANIGYLQTSISF